MASHDNEPTTIAKRFVMFCLAVLGGVILLYFAVGLLSQFWGWLILIVGIICAVYTAVRIIQVRRNRW